MSSLPLSTRRSSYGPVLGLLPILVVVGCLCFSIGSEVQPTVAAEDRARRLAGVFDGEPLRGVVLGLFSQDPTYEYRHLLGEIRDLGCNWVSLCINHYQKHNDSIEIGIPDRRSAPEAQVRATIQEAKRQGLKVFLFPILLLSEPGEDDWRGTLAPSDRDAWYRGYGQLLNRYADMAEEYDVDLLSVGSEFNSMESEREPWLEIIHDVRSRYSGPLTYSVNWDSLDNPTFLDQLDLVGMTTYFSLTDKNDPTVSELEQAWLPIREDILMWRTHVGLPLIFTEVGFASQDGINKDPWNYYISKKVDLQEQVDCFQAFTNIWLQTDGLEGVFFYNWFGHGGDDDIGYTPRLKPALQVIRRWFDDAVERDN